MVKRGLVAGLVGDSEPVPLLPAMNIRIHKTLTVPSQAAHPYSIFLKIFLNLFIYFLAALGLRCCVRAFSSCREQGLLFIAVRGLLTAVASLVAEHGL